MANRFWIANGGNYNDTAHWSTSSGGASGASVPGQTDAIFFDSQSFSSSGQIVNIPDSYTARCTNMDWTGSTNSPTLQFTGTGNGGSALEIWGTLLRFISAMTVTFVGTGKRRNTSLLFKNSSTLTCDTKGVNIPTDIEVQNGNVTLGSDLSNTGGLFQDLQANTFDTGGFNLSSGTMNLSNCTINAHASTFTLTGFTDSDGRIINGLIFNNSAVTWNDSGSIIKFNYNANAVNNNSYDLQLNGQSIGALQFLGTSTVTNPYYIQWGSVASSTVGKFTANPGNWFLIGGGLILTISNFNVNGAAGNLVTFRSDSSPMQYTFTSSIVSISFIDVKDCIASGATPFVDAGGINSGNNAGWTFSVAPPAIINTFFFNMV